MGGVFAAQGFQWPPHPLPGDLTGGHIQYNKCALTDKQWTLFLRGETHDRLHKGQGMNGRSGVFREAPDVYR